MSKNSSRTMSSGNTEKIIKFLVSLKHHTDPAFAGLPSDVIIPVMGPTGVGKSTFINSLLKSVGGTQPCVEVGHGLQSCTSHLKPIVIPFAHGENGENLNGFTNPNGHNEGRLVLVDTPGFDDTYEDDAEILRRISVWLGISYVAGMKLGGVIYLHDITQTRMLGTTRRNLTMFRKLVGEDALKCVFLGTTKWRLVEPAAGAKRQEQLEAVFWKDLIDAGAQVFSVQDQDTPESSVHDQGIPQVNSTLDQDARAPEDGRIHTEVVSVDQDAPEAVRVHDQGAPNVSSIHDRDLPLKAVSVHDQSTPEVVSVDQDAPAAGGVHDQSAQDAPLKVVTSSAHDQNTPEVVGVNQDASEAASVHDQSALNASSIHDQDLPLKAVDVHDQDAPAAGSEIHDQGAQDAPLKIVSAHDQNIPEVGSCIHEQDAPGSQVVSASIHSQGTSTPSSTRSTPRDMVNEMLIIKITHSKTELLLTIQRELVMKRMTIPQTEAGQTLKYSLEQLISLEKRKVKNLSDEEFEQGREELDRLLKAAKELKVPLRTRIKRFFGF